MADYRDEWLVNLSKRMGMQLLEFNSQGICQLTLDQEFILTLYKAEQSTHLVLFGQLPVTYLSPEILKKMLIENRCSAKSSAPIVSLSDEEDAIEVHIALNEQELLTGDTGIDTVIQALEYWKSELAADSASDNSSRDTPLTPSRSHHLSHHHLF